MPQPLHKHCSEAWLSRYQVLLILNIRSEDGWRRWHQSLVHPCPILCVQTPLVPTPPTIRPQSLVMRSDFLQCFTIIYGLTIAVLLLSLTVQLSTCVSSVCDAALLLLVLYIVRCPIHVQHVFCKYLGFARPAKVIHTLQALEYLGVAVCSAPFLPSSISRFASPSVTFMEWHKCFGKIEQ